MGIVSKVGKACLEAPAYVLVRSTEADWDPQLSKEVGHY